MLHVQVETSGREQPFSVGAVSWGHYTGQEPESKLKGIGRLFKRQSERAESWTAVGTISPELSRVLSAVGYRELERLCLVLRRFLGFSAVGEQRQKGRLNFRRLARKGTREGSTFFASRF